MNQKHEFDVGRETLERMAQMPRFNRWLYECIQSFLGKRVLEVGCGIGTMTKLLLGKGETSVVGIDIEEEYVERVRQRFGEDHGRFEAFHADIARPNLSIPCGSGSDAVVCLNVLEHIADDRQALANMAKLLEVGGRLILYVPAHPFLYGSLDRHLLHYRRYSRQGILDLLSQSGFKPIYSRWMNLWGMPGWFLNGKILRQSVLPVGQLRLYDRMFPLFHWVEAISGHFMGQSLLAVGKKEGKA